ncbi:protein DEK isoform X1 [Seriola lalandi dorsalis]|uniref:Protein DEK n=1 Tax=Seriola lalandi dorsalis TaxID=1841481 RepID=A0A3B4XU55_SERLL|nr:protein DEK isoform X1 [Seriola lalandi dorsalis]XP_023252331.1 protein DEK isoform X1 [Seriola lalandi dorsalis]
MAEEAMDSSAVSEEEVEDQMSPKSRNKIPVVGEILEGKRTKKTIERLDFQAPKQMDKIKIGEGSGDKLKDIPRTSSQITKMKPADLKPLHIILFDRPGKMATIKKNLRLFNGFPFDAASEQYRKKREKLLKSSNFTNAKLKVVCGVLDLEKKGTHLDLVNRIMRFLIAPKNSGKRVPTKKKRKSKKKLSGDDSDTKTKKKRESKPRSSSSSPKKSKTGSKSKAIVMDSSSDEDEDEDDDEEDEKAGTSAEAEGSDTEEKPSEKEEDESDGSEQSTDEEEDKEEDDDDEDEDESPKSKSGRGKSAPRKTARVKRQRTPAKKTATPKKRAKKDVSDKSESDVDSDVDEKPKKMKSAPSKPAAKTKKADSSSNSKNNTNTAEDSADDDEPLIKMIKKAPTDEKLKETVQSLLKEANLEEMTMKQICQRVYDTFPGHDLTSKKDFIKQTVKSLIT